MICSITSVGGSMEKLFYEGRPFLYVLLAVYALTHPTGGSVLHGCGVLLAIAATVIFFWRFQHRRHPGR